MDLRVDSKHVFKPKIKPENILDILIAFAGGLIQMVFAIIVPSILFYMLTKDQNLTFILYVFMGIIWALFTVRYICLSSDGIEFKRVLGNPKFISWSQVHSASKATTKETFLLGWLWPPFPAREMTYSLSSIGHYCIIYNNGLVFFPPQEPEKFEVVFNFFYGAYIKSEQKNH